MATEPRESIERKLDELTEGLVGAERGRGPLLQRDYWAVLRGCELKAPEVADLVRHRFCELAPEELVRFERIGGGEGPLQVGDELAVDIRMVGETAVRVVHCDDNSVTVATVEGHPEAGRITFGAYPNEEGEVVFHIRSRARASSGTNFLGFLVAGEAMQTTCWTDYVDCLAHTVGEGVRGVIHAETQTIEDEGEDDLCSPTFRAVGD